MLILILLVVGFVVGLAVGRWWALLAPAGFGVWIALVSEVDEVPPEFLGFLYGAIAAIATAGGVLARRRARSSGASRRSCEDRREDDRSG